MGGGTSRADHSEVGSSYIHFNYTPDGNKTTASLFGDVPRGVMLDQPPIFLGGQGGAVGPLRLGYGTVVAAGSVLLSDVLEDGKLVAAVPPPGFVRDRRPHTYANLTRTVRNNVVYLANLVALEHWYRQVREPFFARQAMGDLVYTGALEMLSLAKDERTRRLTALAANVPASTQAGREFGEHAGQICSLFKGDPDVPDGRDFIDALRPTEAAAASNYLETVQGMGPESRVMGIQWLERIVATLCDKVDGLVEPMDLFDRRS
jgi:bifunctional UDP-N-acetylglucosamine pyrophosphorylase/glucosamine-1-phosphate N-acetyltransferase